RAFPAGAAGLPASYWTSKVEPLRAGSRRPFARTRRDAPGNTPLPPQPSGDDDGFPDIVPGETALFLSQRCFRTLDRLAIALPAQAERLVVDRQEQSRAGGVGHRH